ITGLMMPSILPTTTSGLSLWAAATPTASASATRLTANSARAARRMRLHRRQLAGDRLDLGPQALERRFVRRPLGDGADDLGHTLHVDLGGAAGGHRRRAEADAAG